MVNKQIELFDLKPARKFRLLIVICQQENMCCKQTPNMPAFPHVAMENGVVMKTMMTKR